MLLPLQLYCSSSTREMSILKSIVLLITVHSCYQFQPSSLSIRRHEISTHGIVALKNTLLSNEPNHHQQEEESRWLGNEDRTTETVDKLLLHCKDGLRGVQNLNNESANVTLFSPKLCVLDRTDVRSLVGDEPKSTMQSRDGLIPLAVQAAFSKLNVRHAVTFHSFNTRAIEFEERAKTAFVNEEITVFRVDGKLSSEKRNELLKDSKTSERSIVANCRVLATGTNDVEWEMVVMADPPLGQCLAQQMIEKVICTKQGYVLLPLVYDADREDEDTSQLLLDPSTKSYNAFLTAFNAMVRLDPELHQNVIFVYEEAERLGRRLLRNEYPDRLREAILLPSSMSLDTIAELMHRVVTEVQNQQRNWDEMYSLMVAYRKREGHCNVPQLHMEDNVRLGSWLSNQRVSKKKKSLDTERITRLNELGIVWDFHADQWENNYELLCKFYKREGHCNVPRLHEEDGTKLCTWLTNQRQSKRKGSLDIERITRLDELGIVWDVLADQWESNYQLLCKFNEREGHCNVPSLHVEDGAKLGNWLDSQRVSKKKQSLDTERITRLDELGIVWDVLADQWESNYQLLCNFYEREGHSNVPYLHVEDGTRLGKWIERQRESKKKESLDTDRTTRLDRLHIVWNILADQWESNYQLLRKFYEREGHCNVLNLHVEDGSKLGIWVTNQRQLKKKGSLDTERITRLDELGIIWEVLADQWESNYQLLCKFYDREGHCNVPRLHVEDGTKLGKWLDKQRHSKKKRSLDIERGTRLDELGIIWDIFADQWESNYQLVRNFHEREGHCNVPHHHVEDGTKLGHWVNNQKKSKKKGSLGTEQIIRLDELGIVWDVSAYQWESNYQLVRKFYEREGHCNISNLHVEDGTKLGHWLDKQRESKEKAILDIERITRLDELGIIWDASCDVDIIS